MTQQLPARGTVSKLVVLAISVLAISAFATGSIRAQTIELASHRFDPLGSVPPAGPTAPSAPGESTLALVQFTGPITTLDRDALLATGVEIIDYIPEFAFLVRTVRALDDLARGIDHIRWVGPYEPSYRLSPLIGHLTYVDPDRASQTSYRLRVRCAGDPAGPASEVTRLGGHVLEAWLASPGEGRLLIELPKGSEIELARDHRVVWIEEEPDYRVWNDTTRWVVQSNVPQSTPIWSQGLHGEGRILAIMDTGLDYASCWFRDTGNPPPGPSHRKVIDYRSFGGQPYDGCSTGHGTHVAGTAAGDQSFINAGNFTANGMAYGAKIAFQDIGNDDFISCLFGLVAAPSSLGNAFQSAYDLGARAHTNSWGSMTNAYDSLARDVDLFMWNHRDFLVLFAAGNAGPGGSTVGSPGTAKNLVTVGATRQASQQDVVATYSSRGPASDGRFKPTLMAPGGEDPVFITSADNTTSTTPSCNTASSPFQGTSMATPAVAGLALLVQQYFQEGWYPTGLPGGSAGFAPSAALVKGTLVNAATDMATLDIPNQNEGWGRVLLDGALYFEGEPGELRVEEHPGVATSGSAIFSYSVESGRPLEIVLVWTDYPAASGAGVALVNDLDLVVTGPGGTYRGNVFAGGQSTTGGSADRRNVEEVVRRTAPEPGLYTIEVTGFNVPQGGVQPFALVSTGAFSAWPPGQVGVPIVSGNAPGLRLLAAPNPGAGGFQIDVEQAEPGDVIVTVFDVNGRRVATLFDGKSEDGIQRVVWSGRDGAGRRLSPGSYFVQVRSGEKSATRKLTLLP